jgi:hypothetical protein
MTVAQRTLLTVSIAVFVYLGAALFKPRWFENLDGLRLGQCHLGYRCEHRRAVPRFAPEPPSSTPGAVCPFARTAVPLAAATAASETLLFSRYVYTTARALAGSGYEESADPALLTAGYGVADARCSGASAHPRLTMIAVRGRRADGSRM